MCWAYVNASWSVSEAVRSADERIRDLATLAHGASMLIAPIADSIQSD